MRKEIGVDKDAHWYRVIDLDTEEEIKNCFMADDGSGEYGVYKTDSSGKLMIDRKRNQIMREFKKSNIKLVDSRA